MQAREERLKYLLTKYGREEATEAEARELLGMLKEEKAGETLAELVAGEAGNAPVRADLLPASWDPIWQAVQAGIVRKEGTAGKVRESSFRWWWAAAAVLLLVSGAALLGVFDRNPMELAKNSVPGIELPPARDGAILTLADGSKVLLDDLDNGMVADQNGVKVMLVNGQLTYKVQQGAEGKLAYNTATTPKGRLLRLVLPDGSKVWLNAATSLKYPTHFAGKERKVEVTGEAYFEVAPDPAMPFRVLVNGGTEVEVLGTHFNINSYTNEAQVNITLLEGSIQCRNGMEKALLKPGQQAQIPAALRYQGRRAGKRFSIVDNADISSVMAWKNGVFNFNNANLEEVMRQLERWYDIEVVYPKGIPRLEFIGKMGRDLTLSEVLSGLEMSKVHFRIEEGRKLIIMP